MNKHLPGLHRQEGEEREENDFYATDPAVIPPLLKLLGWENGGKLIRENSCGSGCLSIMLDLFGHKVISSDLIDRGYGITGIDFLQPNELDNLPYDAVVMNPPYKLAEKFIWKSLEIAPVVCAFLRIQFYESEKRSKLFDDYGRLRKVAVFKKRVLCSKDGLFKQGESSAVCYAWFIWDRDYNGPTELVRI